jgi:enterochelin esterase family protein
MKSRFVSSATKTIVALVLILLFLPSVRAHGQDTFNSREVHPDGSITFRYKDAAATKALLHLDGQERPFDMVKDADGVWTVVTPPVPPQIYGYIFQVDGEYRPDPKNTVVVPNFLYLSNAVTVPGSTPQLWDARDVPHGEVHHHVYTSKVVRGLVDAQSNYYVYTPPNYRPKGGKPYPVLYLFHGFSDMANAWIEVGKANFILDNLIAQGKATPMVVVMPLGYGDMQFVLGPDSWGDHTAVDRNVELFSESLLTEILPQVEAEYHVFRNKNNRAIAGLSMGGLESLSIGLTHTAQFGWVGGFSSSIEQLASDARLTPLSGKTAHLNLLWIACGTEEELLEPNRRFIAWLKTKDVPVTAVETPGIHEWMVWRDDLARFAPLLFQGK